MQSPLLAFPHRVLPRYLGIAHHQVVEVAQKECVLVAVRVVPHPFLCLHRAPHRRLLSCPTLHPPCIQGWEMSAAGAPSMHHLLVRWAAMATTVVVLEPKAVVVELVMGEQEEYFGWAVKAHLAGLHYVWHSVD